MRASKSIQPYRLRYFCIHACRLIIGSDVDPSRPYADKMSDWISRKKGFSFGAKTWSEWFNAPTNGKGKRISDQYLEVLPLFGDLQNVHTLSQQHCSDPSLTFFNAVETYLTVRELSALNNPNKKQKVELVAQLTLIQRIRHDLHALWVQQPLFREWATADLMLHERGSSELTKFCFPIVPVYFGFKDYCPDVKQLSAYLLAAGLDSLQTENELARHFMDELDLRPYSTIALQLGSSLICDLTIDLLANIPDLGLYDGNLPTPSPVISTIINLLLGDADQIEYSCVAIGQKYPLTGEFGDGISRELYDAAKGLRERWEGALQYSGMSCEQLRELIGQEPWLQRYYEFDQEVAALTAPNDFYLEVVSPTQCVEVL